MLHKLNNYISLIIGVFSMGILMLSASVSLIIPDLNYSIDENRNLAQFESPNFHNVIDGVWEDNFESYSLDQYALRSKVLKLYFLLLDSIGVNERNGIVRGREGVTLGLNSLRNENSQPIEDNYVLPRLDAMMVLQQVCNDAGCKFISLQIPYKFDYYADYYPALYQDGKNINILLQDSLTKRARDNGIDVVDTSNKLLNNSEYVYCYTDHHTYRGAYYVYRELLEHLNETTQEKLTFPEWDDCQYNIIHEYFVGSGLKKFGYSGIKTKDHIEYVIPYSMPSYLRLENEAVSDIPLIDESKNAYSMFMSGDMANTIVKTDRPQLPTILYIGYSYTNALETMSVYSFDEMHSLDPRHFRGSICDYIRNHDVDYVVLVRNDLYEGNPENIASID